MFHRIVARERISFVGLCAGDEKPDDWHSTEEKDILRAKKVCSMCCVRAECAEYAVRTKQPFGVWGGLTDSERGIVHKTRF